MAKTAKKTSKKAASKKETTPRVKLSELPQGERDKMAHELITQLYNHKGEGEEAQVAKRKLRARLRTIDDGWLETYAKFIERNWPTPAPEKPAKGAKAAA